MWGIVATMNQKTPEEIKARIRQLIDEDWPKLPHRDQEWLKKSMIEPRPVVLHLVSDRTKTATFWLVTEDKNFDNVVYIPEDDRFGVETTDDAGIAWYMGRYGSFYDTVIQF
jgi:hypothetical protein